MIQMSKLILFAYPLLMISCQGKETVDDAYFIQISEEFAQAVANNRGEIFFEKIAYPDCFYIDQYGIKQDYSCLKKWYETDTTSYQFINPFNYDVIRHRGLVYLIYDEAVKKTYSDKIDTIRYIEIYSLNGNQWKMSSLLAFNRKR